MNFSIARVKKAIRQLYYISLADQELLCQSFFFILISLDILLDRLKGSQKIQDYETFKKRGICLPGHARPG